MLEFLRQDLEAGLPMWKPDLQRRRPEVYRVLKRHYPGGREGALRDLGLPADHDFMGRSKTWTWENILSRIRELHDQGKSLRTPDLRESEPGLVNAVHLRYRRKWRDALREAGLDPAQVLGVLIWTAEGVLEWIRARVREGRSLRHKDVVAEPNGQGLYQAARRYFASWGEAVRRAGGAGTRE